MRTETGQYIYEPRCIRCRKKVELTADNKAPRCPECHSKVRTRPRAEYWHKLREEMVKDGRLHRY